MAILGSHPVIKQIAAPEVIEQHVTEYQEIVTVVLKPVFVVEDAVEAIVRPQFVITEHNEIVVKPHFVVQEEVFTVHKPVIRETTEDIHVTSYNILRKQDWILPAIMGLSAIAHLWSLYAK